MNPALAPLAQALAEPAAWFDPYVACARRVLAVAAHAPVAEALNRQLGSRPIELRAGRLRFVPQAALPAGEPYEGFIARTACVPTRDNLHDLLNGLVWLAFPRLKRRLNELQAEVIARDGIGATRGPVRDALTLFDENAAWLQADDGLVGALRAHDWSAAFIDRRAQWRGSHVVCFGHALLEKLIAPRKDITAHAWAVPPGVSAPDWLAEHLTPERLAAKPHFTLPVLGVPGWWRANDDPTFYADAAVFRAARHRLA